jgi:low affinity Fe/Cu permease
MKQSSVFSRFATRTANAMGHPMAFAMAVLIVAAWLFSGPLFGFSDTWQLVINTATTIVTFLMVFLIQNTQNRDGHALQLKLDELIRATKGAHLALLDLERLSDRELELMRGRYQALADDARSKLRHGASDAGTPEINAALPGD